MPNRKRVYEISGRYHYVEVPTNKERAHIAWILVGSIGLSLGVMYSRPVWSVMEARASEPVRVEQILSVPTKSVILTSPEGVANNANIAGHDTSPTTTPSELTEREKIIAYIYEVFGEHGEQAVKVADCESKLIPNNIGDRNLITWNGDDIVGDSIGIFQIRSGGKEFNRARANNMTPDEFRAWMSDARENIKYAKKIFDRQGWQPWTCKKVL